MKNITYKIYTYFFMLFFSFSFSAMATQTENINFTAPVSFVQSVSNAGNIISGTLSFDPTSIIMQYSGEGYASYLFESPATFQFTTNGGFSLTQNLTTFNVADITQNGVTDYYVFDADVGTFNSTPFHRLELALSSNSNPNIADLNIPQSINPLNFQFKTALYYDFDASGNLIKRIVGNVESITTLVTAVPEPSEYVLILVGLMLIGVVTCRQNTLIWIWRLGVMEQLCLMLESEVKSNVKFS